MTLGILSKYNSNSADLKDEIALAFINPLEISRQYSHFLDSYGLSIASPIMEIANLFPLITLMVDSANVGNTYDYNPDKMSNDTYGTHELWPLLLRVNGVPSRAEFTGPILYYIKPIYIGQLLNILAKGVQLTKNADLNPKSIANLTIKEIVL
jgi:hypothetical protein